MTNPHNKITISISVLLITKIESKIKVNIENIKITTDLKY